MAKFFYVPFAEAGSITTVPDLSQPNGSVSYADGFGADYQLPLSGGAPALPIDRAQFNGLINDITGALNIIQQQGLFTWIGNVPELGTNFPYPINALVYYNNLVYQSQIANNTDMPGTSVNWLNISNNGSPIGSFLDFGGLTAPANYLNCDGSSVSQTTYASLFAAITNTQTGSYSTGNAGLTVTNTSNLYVGMQLTGTGIPSGTTITTITNSTTLVMSNLATASGPNPITFVPWGLDPSNSANFFLPDLRRSSRIGAGGTAAAGPGAGVGQKGGTQTYQLSVNDLAPHNHPGSTLPIDTLTVQTGSGVSNVLANLTPNANIALSIATQPSGQTAFSLYQPSASVITCIKYQ